MWEGAVIIDTMALQEMSKMHRGVVQRNIRLMLALEHDEELHKIIQESSNRIVGAKIDAVFIDECTPSQEGWAGFAPSNGIEPLQASTLRFKRRFKEKKPQNNDWRSGRGFNGYHREF